MRWTDVIVIGGGLAGSTAAAMLGRAGIETILVDPHETYPADLRCEKLDGTQVAILRRTGLAEEVLAATTLDGAVWVARHGRLVEKRPSDQHGILYDRLVDTVRSTIPKGVTVLRAKVAAATTSTDSQWVKLSDGEEISARLLVMASGLNLGFGHGLGLSREMLSPCHSITLGFDIRPVGQSAFAFPALTYWPEDPGRRMAYLSLFPVGEAMRANLMVYRDMNDPWLRRMRSAPREAMAELMPRLGRLTGEFEVDGFVKIRPADLYATRGYLQPGLALVGDAFATSCPAAGTGTGKVFTDVERLCNHHIPAWLSTEGTSLDKIAAFYDDPVKRESDASSLAKAYWLRSLSIETGAAWRARRRARFIVGLGRNALRRRRLIAPPSRGGYAPSADGALHG